MNKIVGMLAFMLARKASQAAMSKIQRARARLELGGREGYEVQGRLMVRKKMAGRYLPLESIVSFAKELQEGEDLYFYSPDNAAGDRQYVHAIRLIRLNETSGTDDNTLELEVLPSWSHRGVYIKHLSDGDLDGELRDLMRRLPDFKTAADDFSFRAW